VGLYVGEEAIKDEIMEYMFEAELTKAHVETDSLYLVDSTDLSKFLWREFK
jgi:hypothetical protein